MLASTPPPGKRQAAEARGHEDVSARQSAAVMGHGDALPCGALAQIYPCLVRSCRRTWQKQCDRDEHIARNHPKAEEAKMARRRLSDQMQMALQRGSRPACMQTCAENMATSPRGKKKTQNTDAEQKTVEPAPQAANAKAGTTASWTPRSLEAAARAAVMKREGQPDDCIAATPFAERQDTKSVSSTATQSLPCGSKTAGRSDRRRIRLYFRRKNLYFRRKYSGQAVFSSTGAQKKTKTSTRRCRSHARSPAARGVAVPLKGRFGS